MKIPTNENEVFEFLVEKANAREGKYYSPQTLNELSRVADSIGISYDDKRWDDTPRKVGSKQMSRKESDKLDKVLAKYL